MIPLKYADHVQIKSGLREFVGATGRILHIERYDSVCLYLVLLDRPVELEGVGRVISDRWSHEFLRKIQ